MLIPSIPLLADTYVSLHAYPDADNPDADLVESRSMQIAYWLGDQNLINAHLTKNSMQNINL